MSTSLSLSCTTPSPCVIDWRFACKLSSEPDAPGTWGSSRTNFIRAICASSASFCRWAWIDASRLFGEGLGGADAEAVSVRFSLVRWLIVRALLPLSRTFGEECRRMSGSPSTSGGKGSFASTSGLGWSRDRRVTSPSEVLISTKFPKLLDIDEVSAFGVNSCKIDTTFLTFGGVTALGFLALRRAYSLPPASRMPTKAAPARIAPTIRPTFGPCACIVAFMGAGAPPGSEVVVGSV